MRKVRWKGNGYHSFFPEGEWASPTRENLDYALTLFDEGSAASLERAEAIVREVLTLQDLDPVAPTFGIWPWLREESLEQMAPPDWNWADFCGVRLAHILGIYGERVSADLSESIKTALQAAAYSIFRRNVGPGYTNIAIKGALVCAQAGSLLDIPLFTEYAQRRLEKFIAFTQDSGGFHEYNSPTYGMLVTLEIERGIMLIQDPTMRQLLMQIQRIYWEQTAQSIHIGLGQISGPHRRAYSDQLDSTTSRLISERIDIELPIYEGETNEKLGTDFLLTPIPCPADIQQKVSNDLGESFTHYTYKIDDDSNKRRESAIWKSKHVCLGSINCDNLWTQRRPLLGYWRTDHAIAVLRVRLMHDGQDFASGLIRTQQDHNELLSIITLVTDKGDFHDHLDTPASGTFEIKDFELRIELTAPNAQAIELGNNTWRIQAGSLGAQIQPAFASISGHEIQWQAWTNDEQAGLSARIDQGKALQLNPNDLAEAAIGFYLQLSEDSATPIEISTEIKDESIQLTTNTSTGKLKIQAPLRPQAYV